MGQALQCSTTKKEIKKEKLVSFFLFYNEIKFGLNRCFVRLAKNSLLTGRRRPAARGRRDLAEADSNGLLDR